MAIKAPTKQKIPFIYLGGLLGLMALGQIASITSFIDILTTYGLTSGGGSLVLALVIINLELFAAIRLLFNLKSKDAKLHGAYAGIIVTVLWTFLATQAFIRGLYIPNCGCFGTYLSQPLRYWVLIEDALFVALAVYCLKLITASKKS